MAELINEPTIDGWLVLVNAADHGKLSIVQQLMVYGLVESVHNLTLTKINDAYAQKLNLLGKNILIGIKLNHS